MKQFLLIAFMAIIAGAGLYANPTLTIKSPMAGETYRVGKTVTIAWDTLDVSGVSTWNKTFEFKWSETENGTYSLLALAKNAKSFKDVNSKSADKAAGSTVITLPRKDQIWIRMQEVGNETNYGKVGPINVYTPPPATADSIIQGYITSTVTLSNTKLYQLNKVVYVEDGATLRLEPGTVVMGDPNNVSAICVNRGGKIYAKGTANQPIVFTSGYSAGSRDRGDWGGLLIMGKATTNLGEAAIEGGIADAAKKDAWYGAVNGVNDDNDSSGVLEYVRIEFAGIAESPDNELNSLTMGGVGRKTVINHVQTSYNGDDAFEWFGGTVNAKYLIAYNTIDDDMDTDNGFSGKVQHVLIKRFSGIADQSNSEAFESDNDSKASEKQPFTRPVFANVTVVGPIADTSWTAGTGENKYNAKFLTVAQIRRNSRMNLVNSVLIGFPGGLEMTNQNSVRAAENDSIMVRYNDFYGIKNNKFFYFGSGTNASTTVDANWLSKSEFGNNFINKAGNTGTHAGLTNAFPGTLAEFNPMPTAQANYMTSANWTASNAAVNLADSYFDKVPYRGAFGTERWDMPWAEYDPVNKIYTTTSVKDDFAANVSNLTIEAAPLPANDYTVITYQLPTSREVSIKLFDALGGLSSTIIINEMQSQGVHSLNLNTTDLQSGVYYLQISSNEGNTTMALPVVK